VIRTGVVEAAVTGAGCLGRTGTGAGTCDCAGTISGAGVACTFGATRGTVIRSRGRVVAWTCTCGVAGSTAAKPKAGPIVTAGRSVGGTGSGAACTSAGPAAPGTGEKEGARSGPGPARSRGKAAAAATAPASNKAVTPFVIPLMFPAPDADSITRTRYRQARARALVISEAVLGSFKFKLAVYFLLLSVIPVAAGAWGFASVSAENETHRVDARLQADLRVALAGYQQRVDAAAGAAARLARDRPFQVALQKRDTRTIAALLAHHPGLTVRSGAFHVGTAPRLAVRRETAVITTKGLAGIVVASVPLDRTLVDALRSGAGLDPADRLALLDGGRIVAASPPLAGSIALSAGRIAEVRVAGVRYRTLVAPPVSGAAGVTFAVLTPQSSIDASNAAARDRLLFGLIGAAVLVALVAFLEGRSIVRTVRGIAGAARGITEGRFAERVPVAGRDEFAMLGHAFNDMADQLELRLAELAEERSRLREAFARFGEVLSATHDVEHLQRVVVDAAVEATGARCATLFTDGHRAVAGDENAVGEVIELPLTSGRETLGMLVLIGSLDDEQRRTAASLASQAAVALENERLHRMVERQALVDGLTGIANRRACEDALTHEIARAGRLGTPLSLVVADLDDFKAVNDRHGHPVGDDVLREFAAVLRGTLRDSDVAGRWGGEEFVLLLPGTEGEGGALLAERVRAALSERSFAGHDGYVLSVTCSFGVAQLREGMGERELFAQADRALYEAKRHGKNRVEVAAGIRSL
jgi:diguanylate cyclase (GGDEF)-like protein